MFTGIVEEVGTVVAITPGVAAPGTGTGARTEARTGARPAGTAGDPPAAEADVRRVLLEGGPTLAAAFLRAGLVDEAVVHLAPKLLGAGPPLVGDLGITTIGAALDLRVRDVTVLGEDVQVRLRPTRHTGVGRQADGRD